MPKKIPQVKRLSCIFITLISPYAFASGYNVGTQSVSAQSTANANGAEAVDASVIYSNPAGMMNLQGTQFSLVANFVQPDVAFTQSGQSSANVGGNFVPFEGSNGGEFIDDAVVPHLYLSHRINDSYSVGLGIFVPFGAKAAYEDDFVGKYYSLETELTTLNINPSFAVKVDERHYFGIGLNVQYMDGKLVRKYYGPSITGGFATELAMAGAITPDQAYALINTSVAANQNGELDPRFSVEGDSWGLGVNLGYMFQVNDSTRLGLAYRSPVNHHLEGDAVLTETDNIENHLLALGIPNEALAAIHKNADGKVSVKTPESVSFNIFHQINDKFAVMSDLTWTKHNRLDQVVVEAQPITTTYLQTDWRTTAKISFGGTWQVTEPIQLRAGYMYDESPVGSAETTLPTLPDNDRQWFSLGAKILVGKSNSFDIAYSYIKVEDRDMNRIFDSQINENIPNNPAPDGLGSSSGQVAGTFESSAQIFGVQWNLLM
jgi:long-chain fatty acid transport protein